MSAWHAAGQGLPRRALLLAAGGGLPGCALVARQNGGSGDGRGGGGTLVLAQVDDAGFATFRQQNTVNASGSGWCTTR